MLSFSRISFPLLVLTFVGAGIADFGSKAPVGRQLASKTVFMAGAGSGSNYLSTSGGSSMAYSQRASSDPSQSADTVIYPPYGFKQRLSKEELAQTFIIEEVEDSSLIDSSAFRLSPRDSLKALLDSTLWDKLDSIYIADSTAKAKAKFDAWYASLDRKARRKYDNEQKIKIKMAQADSIRDAKQKKQDIRDSIIAETPRILETYALPDSMYYKRIISWQVDQEFNRLDVSIPDTSYNYHFYDYPFQRNDVNSSWLGVAGSAVQSYNYFKRASDSDVEFYAPYESWSFSPRTLPQYNTKTPYTELAYYGPLFAKQEKESDNIHVLTTQNITPALNLTLLYDSWGGGGMLENEKTSNKTFSLSSNYLGKKYLMHAGFIRNTVSREENGGIVDLFWIRDTTVDSREVNVHLKNASSKLVKNSFYLDQQLRIPFTFISKMKARRDSNFVFNADSLDRDVTTAFIGHSSEFSIYRRNYNDQISDEVGLSFYDNYYYDPAKSADSMRVMHLDNKVYLRLQPWSADAFVSKLDLGAGYMLRNYFDSTKFRPQNHIESSFYIYGGAEGQLKNSFFWGAYAQLALIGYNIGDFRLAAHGSYQFFPWRRNRKSPISIKAEFESTLKEPNWYQQHINSNHFRWDNDFGKISATTLQASIDIPYWKLSASAGYALLANNLWYDNSAIIRQNSSAMSVFTADLRKEFVLGPLHLDHKALFQLSSKPEVLPLPTVALNFRYYLQFVVARNEAGTADAMVMQIGANAFYNTPWHSPAYNPALGVFHNQNQELYTNGPYFDIFINMQWKRACIFVKYQNAGGGWPLDKRDYFSANRYINTTNGMDGLKIGIFWPFYAETLGLGARSSRSSSASGGSGSRGGGGASHSPRGGSNLGGALGGGMGAGNTISGLRNSRR